MPLSLFQLAQLSVQQCRVWHRGAFSGKIGENKGFFLKKWLYFCTVKKGAQPHQDRGAAPAKQTETKKEK